MKNVKIIFLLYKTLKNISIKKIKKFLIKYINNQKYIFSIKNLGNY